MLQGRGEDRLTKFFFPRELSAASSPPSPPTPAHLSPEPSYMMLVHAVSPGLEPQGIYTAGTQCIR